LSFKQVQELTDSFIQFSNFSNRFGAGNYYALLFYLFSYDMTSTTSTTTAMTGMSITHRQHQHHQRVQTSMAAAGTVAAAAGARDETRLEPLVCFFLLFLLC